MYSIKTWQQFTFITLNLCTITMHFTFTCYAINCTTYSFFLLIQLYSKKFSIIIVLLYLSILLPFLVIFIPLCTSRFPAVPFLIWSTSFHISYRAKRFCVSENIYFAFIFETLFASVFSLRLFSVRNLVFILIFGPLYLTCSSAHPHPPLAPFWIFYDCFWVPWSSFLHVLCAMGLSFLDLWVIVFFKFGKILAINSSRIFLSFPFFSFA